MQRFSAQWQLHFDVCRAYISRPISRNASIGDTLEATNVKALSPFGRITTREFNFALRRRIERRWRPVGDESIVRYTPKFRRLIAKVTFAPNGGLKLKSARIHNGDLVKEEDKLSRETWRFALYTRRRL